LAVGTPSHEERFGWVPRYFFNIHDGEDSLDKSGIQLDGMEAAQRHGLQAAAGMLREGTKAGIWAGAEWRLFVTDESGSEVFTLRFAASVPAT
jgi:hypothetical protein